ncbi:MAG TPA: CDP-alcohol phosphatidyltransferase family protein [Clostridiales bacterium]|nr:MAG: CDP-diacylglycerol--glycerol-3-phosphate 3-phosphatidyltransferase [Firmicutes bacterium ADurb.Bin262]HOU11183.1 CDP-alcohol phosphatidyltransferase family protein [Clostridiales bacterium]HQH64408.1 CDP-alcohol phosphatidyltransferase family protein [Clostridiales bacterium]HQK73813.1 CDP-alcohol phosphatidyltransferase family protein [Clostridiales bacterium]
MKDYFKGSLTIPNLLTVIRILLIPVFAWLFYDGKYIWALVVLLLSGLSDTLDGKIARRFNQVSELGKNLDPVADKLTQIVIAVMLFAEFRKSSSNALHLFSWVFLYFLLKEAVMVMIGAIMLSMGIKPGAAEIYGKMATFAFYVVMLLIIGFAPGFGAFSYKIPALVLPETVMMVLVIICAILATMAWVSYLPGAYRQFKEKAEANKTKSNGG